MVWRTTVLGGAGLVLVVSASLALSADASGPPPATQPNDPALSESLQRKLDAAKADAGEARDNYKRLTDAAMAKLENDPDYKVAVAKVDAAKKQLDEARQSASADLSSLSQQYFDAFARVSSIRDAAYSDPLITSAKQNANAATKVVATIQAEIERLAELKNSERPSGYSDAQWTLAKLAFDYRGQCASELEQARQELNTPNEPARMLSNGGFGGGVIAPEQPKSQDETKADQERVNTLQDRLNKIRRGEVVIPNMRAPFPWTAGAAGHLDMRFVVNQVVSGTEMIAQPVVGIHPAEIDIESRDFWVSGFPTAGLADDQETEVKGDFCITSTKTYTTSLGAKRTIFVLEPIDTSNLKPAVDFLVWQSHQPHRAAPGQ
jgi:hypothetical protein